MLEALTLTSLTGPVMVRSMAESTRIRRKAGYHHGDLRAQLIEATRALFEDKGPDGFSVAQACRVAGVSTAAPYRHFRDREEMLEAVVRAAYARKHARMVAALEGIPAGSRARIVALGRVYIGFARDEPGIFRLVFGRHHRPIDDPEAEADAMRPYTLLEEEVAAVLGRAEIDDVVRQRAFLLWTFVHGLSFLLIDGKVEPDCMPVGLDGTLKEIADRVLG